MKKLPQPVKVKVQVTNGKRSVVTNPPSGSTHMFPKKRKVDPPTTSSASKPNFSHKKKLAKKAGNRKQEVAPSFITDTSQEGGTDFCSVPLYS